MDATTQNLDCNKTINQLGVEGTTIGVGMNVKELTHNNNHRLQKLTKTSQQSG